MAENVGSIEYDARINTSDFNKDAKEVEATAKNTGDSIDRGIGDGVKKAGLAMAGIGAALTVVAKKATDFTVDYVKDANKLAREIGGTAEESSRLLFVTGRLGLETEQVTGAFGLFSKKIVESKENAQGAGAEQKKLGLQIEATKLEIALTSAEIRKNGDVTGELGLKIRTLNAKLSEEEKALGATKGAFEKIGVSVLDAGGKQKSFNDILLETADKFKSLPSGADKSAMAMELFGKAGKDMLPFLNLGSQGIQDLEKRADELGLTLNQKTIGAVANYVESQKKLKESTDAMKIAIGTATAPVLTAFNLKLSETAQKLLATEGPLKTVTTNVLAFGGPVASAVGGMLALGANLSTIGKASLITGAKFGLLGIAAVALTGGVLYLGNAIFKVASETGSAGNAVSSWQGKILSSIPIVGQFASGLAALSGLVFGQKVAQNELKAAQEATTQSQIQAKIATDNLANAELNKAGADLAVEQAQKNLTEATSQYGAGSLEARQATFQLQTAQQNQKTATEQASTAVKDKTKADEDLAHKEAIAAGALEKTQRAAEGNGGAFDKAAGAVGSFIRNLLNIPSHVNQPQVSGPVAANNPQFATGGYTGRGRANEIAGTVHKGEYVFPKDAVDQITGMPKISIPDLGGVSTPSSSSPPITVNLSLSGIMTRSKSDERDIAKSLIRRINEELTSKGQPLIAGGNV